MQTIRFIERLESLPIDPSRMVVIGSGFLDALGYRKAEDVDLVVDPETFDALSNLPGWQIETIHDEEVVKHDDVEVWLSWGSEGVPNFEELYNQSIQIEGYHFANPNYVIAQKRRSNRPKDVSDIAFLQEYLTTSERQ